MSWLLALKYNRLPIATFDDHLSDFRKPICDYYNYVLKSKNASSFSSDQYLHLQRKLGQLL